MCVSKKVVLKTHTLHVLFLFKTLNLIEDIQFELKETSSLTTSDSLTTIWKYPDLKIYSWNNWIYNSYISFLTMNFVLGFMMGVPFPLPFSPIYFFLSGFVKSVSFYWCFLFAYKKFWKFRPIRIENIKIKKWKANQLKKNCFVYVFNNKRIVLHFMNKIFSLRRCPKISYLFKVF